MYVCWWSLLIELIFFLQLVVRSRVQFIIVQPLIGIISLKQFSIYHWFRFHGAFLVLRHTVCMCFSIVKLLWNTYRLIYIYFFLFIRDCIEMRYQHGHNVWLARHQSIDGPIICKILSCTRVRAEKKNEELKQLFVVRVRNTIVCDEKMNCQLFFFFSSLQPITVNVDG